MLIRFLPVFIIFSMFVSCAGPSRLRHDLPRGVYRPTSGETVIYTTSWYGRKFHGRRTASGEVYDMYALTAAHKRLPFGTRLKVTYEKTGKSALVTVNDRGPFIRGRDLDLSYGAARSIGLDEDGVAPVKVTFLERDLRYIKYIEGANDSLPQKGASSGRGITKAQAFTIQFGSFRDKENAVRLKQALDLNHSGSFISKASVNGRRYYRVRLGTFSSRSKALSRALAFAEEGYTIRVFTK